MCGITGFIDYRKKLSSEQSRHLIGEMSDTLEHRGPDSNGSWLNEDLGIALGHRRLAILDLTEEGKQPMFSGSNRYCLVFNGEIYNFLELKKELLELGHKFRGNSDTEVILAAVEEWGVLSSVKKLSGMFAIAIIDMAEKELYLVRDRVGEKPLYYGMLRESLVFGSELKALRKHPDFKGTVNKNALSLYLKYNYVPSPETIYDEIYKLKPGTIYKVSLLDFSRFEVFAYWSPEEIASNRSGKPFAGTEREAVSQLESLLKKAIGKQMISDVPIGAFLSGGIDSSTISALMQTQSTKPINTFSIGFNEDGYNEAHHAKEVAKYLGTNHTELYVSYDDIEKQIPLLSSIYDEPFADASQIPTILVSKLARSKVTVCLSGDGGDELFGGYNRHFMGGRLGEKILQIPKPLRKLASSLITSVSPQRIDTAVKFMKMNGQSSSLLGEKLHKLASVLSAENSYHLYDGLVSHWKEDNVVNFKKIAYLRDKKWDLFESLPEKMMFFDLINYLPDDVLVKVDRASMSQSLETRVPMLDHEIIEYSWSLPLSMKIRGNVGKWILREVLYKHVPRQLIDRPKMGFSVPIGTWLRGTLKEWADDLLNPVNLKNEGFFNSQIITTKWNEHVSGKRNWQYQIWSILMFQSWMKSNKVG